MHATKRALFFTAFFYSACYASCFCCRELLYGLAHLLGWSFDVSGAPTALGTSSIPPATTMIFELNYRGPQVTCVPEQTRVSKSGRVGGGGGEL